jgi:flagellar protein FlaF
MSSRRPPNKSQTYGKASGSYGSLAKKHAGSRDVEAQALLKAARKLQDLQNSWDKRSANAIEETLKYNRQIWVLFYDNAINENAASQSHHLHTNIINLAGFVFKRSVDILADPERDKLNILININREIAAGLMSKPIIQTQP